MKDSEMTDEHQNSGWETLSLEIFHRNLIIPEIFLKHGIFTNFLKKTGTKDFYNKS